MSPPSRRLLAKIAACQRRVNCVIPVAERGRPMAHRIVKTTAEIEAEITWAAQLLADADEDGIAIKTVKITPLREASPEGVHWTIGFCAAEDAPYVRAAAEDVMARAWDIEPA